MNLSKNDTKKQLFKRLAYLRLSANVGLISHKKCINQFLPTFQQITNFFQRTILNDIDFKSNLFCNVTFIFQILFKPMNLFYIYYMLTHFSQFILHPSSGLNINIVLKRSSIQRKIQMPKQYSESK